MHPLLSLLHKSKSTQHILQIQAQLIATDLAADPSAASKLLASVAAASNSSRMGYAELVFSQIQVPNTFMCNSMVIGYVNASTHERAIQFYAKMRGLGHLGDNYTYPFLLKACGMVLGATEGRQVHGEIIKVGFGSNLFVVNSLISMYGRCGEMCGARLVFDGFCEKDVVSYNSLLRAYVGFGRMVEAQRLFDEMPKRDVVSWSIMIDGYGKSNGDMVCARMLFDHMPARDSASWNCMIHAYAKAGEMAAAHQLFNDMPKKTVVSWSIIIDGYAQHGNPMEALNLFRQMLCQRIKPDKVSMVGALLASAQLGALDQGRWIHIYMEKNKISMDVVVQTALVDMYMKCGSINEARHVFENMLERSVISWNVVILGLGMNNLGKEALKYFVQMEAEGVLLDDMVFLAVLVACSYTILVNEGLLVFERMRRVHGIEPKVEHYGCLVDLFGRAGELDSALDVIEMMPLKPNAAVWGSLLLACKNNADVAIAEFVLDRLIELEANDCGVYVLMSNIYADAGMWGEVQRVRKLIRERNMKKEIGRSVIQIDGGIEEFVSGERSHVKFEAMEAVIESFLNIAIDVQD